MRNLFLLALFAASLPAAALDSPWIGVTYFYWYQWDYDKHMGNWIGGVYNTPLMGYYDSARLEDNIRELKCASEWGVTHHFMDFWGHGWLDEKGRPREQCLYDAAQAVREKGYDIWMSIYQDGQDYQMDDFERNADDGRQVDWLNRNFATHPLNPRIAGRPIELVYGRNGSPKQTITDEKFRQWLREKYGTIDKLNARWAASFRDWAEVRWNPEASGVARADAILCQYDAWAKSLNAYLAKAEAKLGHPAYIPSFDIAYQPYFNWGYSLQTKTFAGPHSYGGIFGQPHDQDAERFIQAAVAKWYGTVFFDTYKNFYHDWEIRIPGMCFPPEPCHFDRFWTIALAHYAEALLHLSWNEWWEGSNLEPCMEYGKTFCEKNLLYATVMKACFDSIRRAQTSGQVAVLLNDWQWLASGRNSADVYGTIQGLRAASVDFKLLPDDFVTDENLRGVKLVVAPGAAVGFGYNAKGEPITEVLLRWLNSGADKRLVVSALPGPADNLPAECGANLRERFGLRDEALPRGAAQPATMNAFVDVGEKGDETFLLSGFSGAEDWARLNPGAFGARDAKHTVRWLPGSGSETQIILPMAPEKEHLLAFAGDVAWPNTMEVLVNDRPCGEVELTPGYHQWEIKVPAEATTRVGVAIVTFRFAVARVPNIETGGKNPDGRVCNLALDWIHIRTPDQPPDRRVPARLPESVVNSGGILKGVPATKVRFWLRHVWAEGASAHSCYANTGFSRDILLPGGKVWYCNGFLGDQPHPAYWRAILDWGGVQSDWNVTAPSVIGARLQAGTTTILAAYNTDISKPRNVRLAVKPDARWPLAEAQAITRDGEVFLPLGQTVRKDGMIEGQDTMHYCGLYQFTFCPVKPTLAPMQVVAGGTHRFQVKLTNLTSVPVAGRVTLRTWLPSVTAPWVDFRVGPKDETKVTIDVSTTLDLEWGRKTVALVIEVARREAFFWRPVTVLADPEWEAVACPRPDGKITVRATAKVNRWAKPAPIQEVKATLAGDTVPTAVSGGQPPTVEITIPRLAVNQDGRGTLELSYRALGMPRRAALSFDLPPPIPSPASVPEDAVAAFVVQECSAGPAQPVVLMLNAEQVARLAKGAVVRDAEGRTGPAGVPATGLPGAGGRPVFCSLPSAPPGPFFLCPAEAEVRRDLSVEKLPDGRLRVQSSELLAIFDPAKGGTITELRWRGGRNLACNSFGASWGQWGKFDPLSPTVSADRFLSQERKQYQHAAPAEITVAVDTPACVVVCVRQKQPEIELEQWYQFYPYVPFFQVLATARPASGLKADEIAVLDIPLEKGAWNKIFPNFTGVETHEDQVISGGWREGPYVPPVATVFDAHDYRNSLSLVNLTAQPEGVWFRQGFFPRQRGKPGVVNTARLEVVAKGPFTASQRISVQATVLLHDGYQWAAQQAAKTARLLEVPTIQVQGRRSRVPPARSDWWHPGWEMRATAGEGPIPTQGLALAMPLRVAAAFVDPESVRAVWQTNTANTVLQAHATALPDERVVVSIPQPEVELGPGTLFIYARTISRCPVAQREPQGVCDPSFERGGDGWSLAGASIDESLAHSGKRSVKLHTPVPGSHSLAATPSVAPAPNSVYRVSFWARTETPGAYVNLNFYCGAAYDFSHVGAAPTADGQWHRYEVDVPTGHFPPAIHPDLRIWVYHLPGPVWIDDVEVQPVRPGPPPAPLLTFETYAPQP